jgi:hypothetical protein
LAVATDTLWVPFGHKATSPHSTGWAACAGRRCHAKAAVRPIVLPRHSRLARAYARVLLNSTQPTSCRDGEGDAHVGRESEPLVRICTRARRRLPPVPSSRTVTGCAALLRAWLAVRRGGRTLGALSSDGQRLIGTAPRQPFQQHTRHVHASGTFISD